ncbi:CPSF A subunit region-domain-containing protein [Halteromyces radiatus]|uniref:CPSF A subunit region-domain-containing protein n=1 Tax=Halteromyces radiatus TaxID=101107 RepID=UPI00221EB6FF|nr:CPSF A subunit region-domain-containing protein [Halteromyces radiatus]KAI8084961.1 CPSF A subunit region-domain-containing protein [Halteromyces radiatus]
MSAYTIYKELFPPQTIEHVEQAQFTAPGITNIIVAKASLLQIYNLIEYIPEKQQDQNTNNEEDNDDALNTETSNPIGDKDDDSTLPYPNLTPLDNDIASTNSARLELVAQYNLNGTITTMGVIRTCSPRGKEGCDSLLLGFEDAKMSLLEWSPATNSITTVSIHYYEREELKKEHLSNTFTPSLHVDPQQRCAILNFYNDKVAVLPFRQADQLDTGGQDYDEDDPLQKRPYLPSFIIDLPSIDKNVKNVVDMVFLSDYYEPTLAILYQAKQTWTGRLDEDKDTASIMVISLDLTEKVYPVIYSLHHLPYDSLQLVAMPKPIHGMMVISANALLYVSQGSPGVGVGVNAYAKSTTAFPSMKYDPATVNLGLILDGARALYLSEGVCLLFLQNGDWAIVQFVRDGNKVVGLQVTRLPFGQIDVITSDNKNTRKLEHQYTPVALVPTCVCNVKDGDYFFLASRVGNSLLIKWRDNGQYFNTKNSTDHGYTFRVVDELLNTGPITDMVVGDIDLDTTSSEESNTTAPETTAALLPDVELVTASGYGKNGALCILRRHIRSKSSFSFDQTDCQALWTIKHRTNDDDELEADIAKNMAFNRSFDKLLFISKSSSTLVLAAGDELQELEKSGFYTKGPTVLVSTLFNHTRIVQIHEKGLYLLTPGGKRLQSIPVRESRIVEASVHDPYIVLVLENQTIMTLQCDATTKDIIYVPVPSSLNKPKNIYSASVFADTSGLFTSIKNKKEIIATMKLQQAITHKDKKRKAEEDMAPNKSKKLHGASSAIVTSITNKDEFDEIDMDLYGDSSDEKDTSMTIESSTDATTLNMNMTDDDESLYGSSTTGKSQESQHKLQQNQISRNRNIIDEANVSMMGGIQETTWPMTFWCVVYTKTGELTLYSLPDLQECYHFPKLNLLLNLVTDYPVHDNSNNKPTESVFLSQQTSTRLGDAIGTIKIKEFLLTNIGKERKDPHLVLRTSTGDIIIYKAFEFIPTADNLLVNDVEVCTDAQLEDYEGRLALRFSRVHHDYISRYRIDYELLKEQELEAQAQKEKEEQAKLVVDLGIDDNDMLGIDGEGKKRKKKKKNSSNSTSKRRERMLSLFMDVSGYSGVFVAGPEPLWLMSSSKSFVRVHPMKTDRPIRAFSQFHNVNCLHGFITIDIDSRIRLCTLPNENTTYDMDWLVEKIPLGQTVHKIKYHPTMRVYGVLVSTAKEAKVGGLGHGGDEEDTVSTTDGATTATEHKMDDREPGAFLPKVDRFSLLLISPVTWETVDQVTFDEFEQGLSLECVPLESKQTSSGRKHFLTVGTGVLRGEDSPMKGAIYVYEVIEVVPEPDNPQTNHKFKFLHKEDVKGAVTAMCDVSGHLAACIGSKMIVWSFEDNESLVGVAFIDVQIYVTCMCSIKNFILLGDVQKSIWFLGFQLEPAKLVLLGKDYQSFEVGSVNYIIDDKSLYLMVGDTDDNLDIYQYAPYNLQSIAGQKLMRRGDFHVGSQVRTMIRLPQITINNINDNKTFQYSRRHFCLCGSFSGSISVVSPIPEKTFKRLNTLYGQLVNSIQHVAGLNPRAYRLIKGSKQRMASNRTKAVLDGDLIHAFAGLAVDRQKDLTKQIGTTVPRIMEDIVEIMGINIDYF